ncbi:response regulator [bacterium]|nr:response regulator [bacterium]
MKRILIVDDEKVVLDVLERILARLGYSTVVAHSGDTALELYAKEKNFFDLVLLDVLMPGKNGFQIAEEMRRLKPDQRIVLVTGMGENAINVKRENASSVKINDVLAKPFSFEKIKSLVEEMTNN